VEEGSICCTFLVSDVLVSSHYFVTVARIILVPLQKHKPHITKENYFLI